MLKVERGFLYIDNGAAFSIHSLKKGGTGDKYHQRRYTLSAAHR